MNSQERLAALPLVAAVPVTSNRVPVLGGLSAQSQLSSPVSPNQSPTNSY
jgi:hypothetical protein